MEKTTVYFPTKHFCPPKYTEKISLRECMVDKLQFELEKHTGRKQAEKIFHILESNGFTYFQKFLDTKLSAIQKIKGIGPKSMEIIKAVRASYGIKEDE